ncbi:MAG: carbon-nitrogen hydrolase family protein [Deltaproteobacteria bacterium]|nr:carbon-nitrogen hydrolase family protein [Deltaproteobacteria bacterium]
MARILGIAGVQMHVAYGRDHNEAMLDKLEKVAALFPWVDVIFFSELCASGLDPKRAVSIPNAALDAFCAWSKTRKKWVIPGSFYETGKKGFYNSAVVISSDGDIVAHYRKLFPWKPLENAQPGKTYCTFDIPGKGRFGLCICYDQWFPELARSLACLERGGSVYAFVTINGSPSWRVPWPAWAPKPCSAPPPPLLLIAPRKLSWPGPMPLPTSSTGST